MAYVLAALVCHVGTLEALADPPARTDLRQGFVLVPITEDVRGPVDPSREALFDPDLSSLTDSVVVLAERMSRAGPVAYLEVELFGGQGTQTGLVWRDGAIALGPLTHEFSSGEGPQLPRSRWPVNAALAELGASNADAADCFDALGLGRHRMTETWLGDDDQTAGPGPSSRTGSGSGPDPATSGP
jgi:hypothetical protein